MGSMSINPAAAAIGSRLVDVAGAVPGLASSVDEEQDDSDGQNPGEPQPGERLL
jgi:hypothetical protein